MKQRSYRVRVSLGVSDDLVEVDDRTHVAVGNAT